MARYCANCGTEVDDTAVFCPTCGQPIDQGADVEIPAAPAWPDRAPAETAAPPSPEVAVEDAWQSRHESAARYEQPTRVEQQPDASSAPPPGPPPAVPPAGPPPDGAPRTGAPQRPAVDLPITWPVTMSGWLIGVGALLAALGALIGLFGGLLNAVDIILLVALLAVAAAVFFSASLPAFANLRLVTLVIVLIGLGVALDRLALGVAGAGELLLFLGTAAAAIGAILLELGRDQPLGGTSA